MAPVRSLGDWCRLALRNSACRTDSCRCPPGGMFPRYTVLIRKDYNRMTQIAARIVSFVKQVYGPSSWVYSLIWPAMTEIVST